MNQEPQAPLTDTMRDFFAELETGDSTYTVPESIGSFEELEHRFLSAVNDMEDDSVEEAERVADEYELWGFETDLEECRALITEEEPELLDILKKSLLGIEKR